MNVCLNSRKDVCFWGDETIGHMGTNLKVILKSRFLNPEMWLNGCFWIVLSAMAVYICPTTCSACGLWAYYLPLTVTISASSSSHAKE